MGKENIHQNTNTNTDNLNRSNSNNNLTMINKKEIQLRCDVVRGLRNMLLLPETVDTRLWDDVCIYYYFSFLLFNNNSH